MAAPGSSAGRGRSPRNVSCGWLLWDGRLSFLGGVSKKKDYYGMCPAQLGGAVLVGEALGKVGVGKERKEEGGKELGRVG